MNLGTIYGVLLRVYPPEFYERHGEEMAVDFIDLVVQYRGQRLPWVWRIARDYAISLVREYMRMLFDSGLRRVFLVQGIVLTMLVSALALMTYAVGQQVLRHAANDPQIEMASDAAAEIADGASPAAVVPTKQIDVARSLAPFLIVYDDVGQPIASSATLHGKVPRPPIGVFNAVRSLQRDALTWQPEPGVRIASITYRFSGARSGFVLAGRSLREVERREDMLLKLVACGWLALIVVLLAGTFLLLRFCPASAKV